MLTPENKQLRYSLWGAKLQEIKKEISNHYFVENSSNKHIPFLVKHLDKAIQEIDEIKNDIPKEDRDFRSLL